MDTIPTTRAERELPDLIQRATAGETIIMEAPSGERVRLEPVHEVAWWLTDAPSLRAATRLLIKARENQVFVGAASCWEIAMKVRSGNGARRRPWCPA
jgi:hypothetical protein